MLLFYFRHGFSICRHTLLVTLIHILLYFPLVQRFSHGIFYCLFSFRSATSGSSLFSSDSPTAYSIVPIFLYFCNFRYHSIFQWFSNCTQQKSTMSMSSKGTLPFSSVAFHHSLPTMSSWFLGKMIRATRLQCTVIMVLYNSCQF